MPETSEQTPKTLVLEQKNEATEQEALVHSESFSDEQIQEFVEEFLISVDDEEKEADLSYEEIAKVFLDAHTDRVEELQREKRGLILEMLLENPDKAFRSEFLQLKELYKDRTETGTTDALGSTRSDFCTADHEKNRADYLFHYWKGENGREKFEVAKVYDLFGESTPVTVSLVGDEFHVAKQSYKRGEYYDVELEGEDRESVLAQLFYDTIKASALQMERSADEREENDRLAKSYLATARHNSYTRH